MRAGARRVGKLLNELREIKREEILRVVQSVPAPWDLSPAVREALVDFLSRRAEWLTDRLPGLLWEQQEMNLDSL